MTLSPSRLDFGNIKVRTVSAAQTITVTNITDAYIEVAEEVLGGQDRGDFYVRNKSCELAAHASCQFSVQFVPTKKGARTATMRVIVDYTESKAVVLSGTGI